MKVIVIKALNKHRMRLEFLHRPGKSLSGKPVPTTCFTVYANEFQMFRPKEEDFAKFNRNYDPDMGSPPLCLAADGELIATLDESGGVLVDWDGKLRWCFHEFAATPTGR